MAVVSSTACRAPTIALVWRPCAILNPILSDINCLKFANLVADTAAYADFRIDMVNLFALTRDGVDGAVARAHRTARAVHRINLKGDQRTAYFGRTAVLVDVSFVFVHEMLHG